MRPIPEERRVLAFIYSLALLQGLTINLMPPLFRHIGEAFQVGMARQGQLQSALYFGTLLIGIAGGVLFERLGTKRAATAAILLVSAGAVLMAAAPSHAVLIAGGAVFGMGNGWMTIVFSAAVARRFNERRQKVFTWAMLFLAVGGTAGPYGFSLLIERAASWRLPLMGLGTALAAGGLGFYLARTPALERLRAPKEERTGSYLAVLRHGRLWLTTALFLLHGFGGGILIAWIGRLYQDRLSVSDGRAALLLSANAAGFFVGRLILGTWLAGKLPDRVLLGLCAAGGTTAYVALVAGHNYTLALAIICCFGVMMSGDAPSVYSLVARQFAASAGVAFALVQAMGAAGSTTGPWLIGWLGEKYGLHRAIWVGPAFLLTLSLTSLAWELLDRLRARRAALNVC